MSQIPGVHQRSVRVSKYIEQSTIRLIISTTKTRMIQLRLIQVTTLFQIDKIKKLLNSQHYCSEQTMRTMTLYRIQRLFVGVTTATNTL